MELYLPLDQGPNLPPAIRRRVDMRTAVSNDHCDTIVLSGKSSTRIPSSIIHSQTSSFTIAIYRLQQMLWRRLSEPHLTHFRIGTHISMAGEATKFQTFRLHKSLQLSCRHCRNNATGERAPRVFESQFIEV